MSENALVWFRRDLRSDDHAALHHALAQHTRVHCVFVFDRCILDRLTDRRDRRVSFIHACLRELDDVLRRAGGGLLVRHGDASEEIPRLADELGVAAVFANRDYEPFATARDARVAAHLEQAGRRLYLYKDQVIFERDEILSRAGEPYSVYTPYRNAWLKRLATEDIVAHNCADYFGRLARVPPGVHLPTLEEIGFERHDDVPRLLAPGMSAGASLLADFAERIDGYRERRNYPGVEGPSYLSVHLRFGTVSIRSLVAFARQRAAVVGSAGADAWLGELIWREFFQMILAHHPHTTESCFHKRFDALVFDDIPDWYAAWCEGRTGYPLVDAGMRQLNTTGYMHNRLRMLAASFLVKDLGIDWRRGERYFAARLNDYDQAANIGGWQWSASVGCDAQPWFRIFNPLAQSRKFDPTGRFIRRYVPELSGLADRDIHAPWLVAMPVQAAAGVEIGRNYPAPIVDHELARRRCLQRYAALR